MNKTKRRTKSIAAIAAAVALAASVTCTTVSADAYYPYYSYASTATTSTSSYSIPNMIYMTEYTSGTAARYAKANAVIAAAQGLLDKVSVTNLGGVSAPAFNNLSLYFAPTKYDYLIKANAENGATVLTFNSQSALSSAMTKIKAEEQTIMNNALLPYQNYIDSLISSGIYTRVNNGDNDDAKAEKLSNAAILNAVKSTLTYTYLDTDLFRGDVTGRTKTYQIAYLSEASIGNSSTQTVVSNDEEFTNFPRLIINGMTVGWDSVHHLNLFNNSNDSWWFALKDGNTLNNDYYWLGGMMIPDFNTTISFDAYAGRDWAQYGASPSNSGNNDNYDNNTTTRSYYYNNAYNYPSDYVYQVTNGNYTYYYPNADYAKAACAANKGYYISTTYKSNHSSSSLYFCFIDGNYYANSNQSRYPADTVLMSSNGSTSYGGYYINNGNVYDNRGNLIGSASTRGYSTNATWFCTDNGWFYSSAQSGLNGYYVPASSLSYGNYYLNNGYVYDGNGNPVGNAASRGYSTSSTWFCTDDGRFYNSAQNGKRGYNVSTYDTNNVDMNDPYYKYWTMKLEELQKERAEESSKPSNTTTTTTKPGQTITSTSTTTGDESIFVSSETMAALRASGDTLTVSPRKNVTWEIKGENVKTPRDINLRVTYNTKNIPAPLKAALVNDEVVATSTITIGENLTFGANATLTMKFDAKRANFIAKLYRYDTSANALVFVNTATIGNNGYVTFNNVDHGGDYIITLG